MVSLINIIYNQHVLQRSRLSYSETSLFIITLAVLILAGLNTYAIFFNGAYFLNAMTLCVVGGWLLVIALLFSNSGGILANWKTRQWLVLAIAFAFWLWVGFSMFWSISREATWIEFSRTGGYLTVLATGMAIGGYRFSRRLSVFLFLVSVTTAVVYGLGSKALPSLIENLDNLGRIAVPIGYANAMGLLMAMGYALSIYISAARDFHWLIRIISALAAPLILTCLFFTTSRGAIFALIVGVAVYFSIVPLRLRSFGVMMLSMIPVILISAWSNRQDALMLNFMPMDARQLAASSLRLYLIISVIGVGAVISIAMLLGKHVKFPPVLIRVSGSAILASVLITVIVVVTLFFSSKPSFREWASDSYQSFRYGMPSIYGVARLLEMGSSGRWLLWEEAMENFKDNPIRGTGGQTFPLVHLMIRENEVFVKQPHSHPFRLLTELGLVGFTLGMAYITVSLAFCARLLCRLRNRWDRALAGAILSVIVVYLIHAAYDWDWNVYGLTMIWFLFTGILLGWEPDADNDSRIRRHSDDESSAATKILTAD